MMYDTVDRASLYGAMRAFNTPFHLIRLIKETLSNVTYYEVKVQNKMHLGPILDSAIEIVVYLLFNLVLQ